jgi:hypothetical protein
MVIKESYTNYNRSHTMQNKRIFTLLLALLCTLAAVAQLVLCDPAPNKIGGLLSRTDGMTEGIVEAWEKMDQHIDLRRDVKICTSLSKALDDQYLRSLNIDLVISNKWKGYGFGCPTCPNSKKPFINDMIDALDHFKQFQNVDGYQTVLNQLLNQGKTKAIGSHWVMKFVKQKQLNPSKFEDYVDEASGDFSVDIFESGKFIECKSWGGKLPGMGNVPNQLINYFNTQNTINFQVQFDPDRWVPTPDDLNAALKLKSNLFDTNKWPKYKQMFNFSDNEVTPNNINELINFITTKRFNLIINP